MYRLTAMKKPEPQPEGAACSPHRITLAQTPVIRACPNVGAVTKPTDQGRDRRRPLEILKPQRHLMIRG